MDVAERVFLLLLTMLILAVWVFALYRAATCELLGPRERGIWVVFIAIFNVLGAIAFLLALGVLRKYQRKAPQDRRP
jgi:hypothetical protein